jgi:hypothetical protein
MRIFAIRALAELGQVVDPMKLLVFLNDDDYVVRQECCSALGVIGGPDVAIKLKEVAEKDWHESVRYSATMAIHQINTARFNPKQKSDYYSNILSVSNDKIRNQVIPILLSECGREGKTHIYEKIQNSDIDSRRCIFNLLLNNE